MTRLGLEPSRGHAPGRVEVAQSRAMGTDVHVIVVGGRAGQAERALADIDRYEQLWSRFRRDSELNAVNAAAGRPTVVSAPTIDAIAAACDAYHETGGAFDPTVLGAMVDAGYDRDFGAIEPTAPGARGPAPGLRAAKIDRAARTVELPVGVGLDLGGIAKGLAADLVSKAVIDAGAAGCCVNIGGDLRARGEAADSRGWLIEYPLVDGGQGTLALREGAVCTSSTTKRRWRSAAGEEHHVRDPRSGQPLRSGLVAITVIAERAAQADVLTKVGLAAGPDRAEGLIVERGATGRAVTAAGRELTFAGFTRFVSEAPHCV